MAKKTKDSNLSLEEKLEQALIPNWDEPYKLPDNWCWTKINSISEILNGYAFKSAHYSEAGVRIIRITNVQDGFIEDEKPVYYPLDTLSEIEQYMLKNNDLLMSLTGNVGRVALMKEDFLPAVLNQRVACLRVKSSSIDNKYLFYCFLQKTFVENCTKFAKGSAQLNMSTEWLKEYAIPLPPLSEQQRIVARIESLFAKLDEAKEKAQEVVDGFETRKAAILHKAFSGELTAKWREENKVGLETWESVIISDICEVNPKKINVKNLSDDLEVSFFPMSALSEIYGKITEPQTRKLKEVKTGFTNFSEGDVVFAKITPCMENGKSAVIGKLVNDIGYGTTEFYVLRCKEKLYNRYLYHLVRSKFFRDEAKCVMTGAVGQQRVPKSFIEDYELKLPSFDEQEKIVDLLDIFFEKEQQVKETAESVIEQIDTMKKAILARAFRGELGTNDPSEESAVELLKKMLDTALKPKKPMKRVAIPKSLDHRIKTDLERKIIKLYIQNDTDILPINLIMGVSSKKFEIIEALRNLQQRELLEKQNDNYKLLG